MSTYDDTVSSPSYVERPRQDLTQSTESMNVVDYSISKANIPSFRKILVPDMEKKYQIKHLVMRFTYQIFLEQKLSFCV